MPPGHAIPANWKMACQDGMEYWWVVLHGLGIQGEHLPQCLAAVLGDGARGALGLTQLFLRRGFPDFISGFGLRFPLGSLPQLVGSFRQEGVPSGVKLQAEAGVSQGDTHSGSLGPLPGRNRGMRRVGTTGSCGFRQKALRAVLVAGIDPGRGHEAVPGRAHLHGDAALRVLQPEPGHLDHHWQPFPALPGVQVRVLHRERCGVKTLHPVDGADLLEHFLHGWFPAHWALPSFPMGT